VAPTAGFHSALRTTSRRERTGATVPEGYAPYVLAAVGGASLFLLWLKVASLAGLRDTSVVTYRWNFLVAAAVIGALLGVLAQFVWGVVAARLGPAVGTEAKPRAARLVWGASAAPQVIALALLVPLDLLIVGPASFTSQKLEDPVASAWAALSIALSVALAVWSIFLFVKGLEVVAGLRPMRAAVAAVAAAGCLAAVVIVFRFLAVLLSGAVS